ncbi:hypothetical protein SHIRM173S_01828 [Streptomyces hirsutus]
MTDDVNLGVGRLPGIGAAVRDTVRDRVGRVMGHVGRTSSSARSPVAANGTPTRSTCALSPRPSC